METFEYKHTVVVTKTITIRVHADSQLKADVKATCGSMNDILQKEGVEKIDESTEEHYVVTSGDRVVS